MQVATSDFKSYTIHFRNCFEPDFKSKAWFSV
jgi:hypothetical protein